MELNRAPVQAVRRRLDDELSWRLVRDRYRVFDRLRSDKDASSWVSAHLFGRPSLVVQGVEGVHTFYDPQLVSRHRAIPTPVRLVLFGPETVHRLDGHEHRQRKQLMVELTNGNEIKGLAELVGVALAQATDRWTAQGTADLFAELVQIYGSAAIEWVGAPTTGPEAAAISGECAAILDGFGVGGTPYTRAVLGRVRAQRWALGVIRDTRSRRWTPPHGSVVDVLASQPIDELSDMAAATELINIVRPTVAIAYFAVFGAHALDSVSQDTRQSMAMGDERQLRAFEHEVRRWYPFVPLLAGRLRRPYRWNDSGDDVTLESGDWLVLDVRGTNLAENTWTNADRFAPERFLDREPTAYDYVPQGGGELLDGHRCPGEPITIGVLQTTLQQLAMLEYDVAHESQSIPLSRIPSLPVHGLRLHRVRRVVADAQLAR